MEQDSEVHGKASSGLPESEDKLFRPSRFIFGSSMYVTGRGDVGMSGHPAT